MLDRYTGRKRAKDANPVRAMADASAKRQATEYSLSS